MRPYTFYVLPLAALLIQCTPGPSEQVAEADAQATESPAVHWNLTAPEWTAGVAEWTFPARWEATEQGRISVSYPTAVKIEALHVAPGQTVAKGALIAEISHPLLIQWQETYVAKKWQMAQESAAFARWKKLFAQGEATELEWRTAQAQYEQVKASLAGAAAQLALYGVDTSRLTAVGDRIEVRSPMAGQVQHLWGNVGSFLPAEQPLTDLINTAVPRLVAQVAPEVGGQLEDGAEATVTSEGHTFKARVNHVARAASAEGLVSVWFSALEAPNSWISGDLAEIKVSVQQDSAYALPASALLYEGEQAYVVGLPKGAEAPAFVRQDVTVNYESKGSVYLKNSIAPLVKVVTVHSNRAAAMIVE